MECAGLSEATVLGLQLYRPPGDAVVAQMAAGFLQTLLPVLDRTGLATPEEVDLDTLEDRLTRDSAHHDAISKLPTLVGAWATPASSPA